MDSINLLEELNLNDYYPQKLSFGVATTLRDFSPQGCQKHYGLEIVRRLLMFDSTAVVSVTTEMNKRIHNAGNKETKTTVTDEGFSDDVRSKQKNVAKSSRRRKLNPMDLLIVAMNCCDDFLRQILIEKMFANKLSIPILLPDVKNGSSKPTLLLLALRSLVPDVSDSMRAGSGSMTLVDAKNPVVSFIRAGSLHRSKSKLVNYLLNFNSFDTFFHRDCPYGSVKRLVSNGSIETAWFQSLKASEKEFNCRLFTALNLRGDARAYPKQTQFLCRSSTLVVFMVDSFESFKELYGNVLKDVTWEQRKIIVCFISSESHYDDDKTDLDLWDDSCGRGIISAAVCDWNDDEKLNDLDFTSVLRETVSNLFKPERINSDQMLTYSDISRYKQNFGFLLDEEKPEYNMAKVSADQFIDSVFNLRSDCKPILLPLQGEPWVKIGELEREQRRTSPNKNNDEHYIAQKETEKRQQRELQCRCLIQRNDITHTFSSKFHSLQNQTLLYYLNYCKIKLDARSRVIMSEIIEECKTDRQGNQNEEEYELKLSKVRLKISSSAIGLEHILREHGQMYEALISEEICIKDELENATITPDAIRNFPAIVARLLLNGQPLELMDGDASNVAITWLKAVLNEIKSMTSNAKVFVLSIIGIQSSGKSTLLNTLFGLQFPVSAGRCTKGIYCHLVPIDKESLQVEYDYVLVADTEGIGASEFTGKSTFRDNELSTFAIGLADATIINIKGESWADITDILQIVAHGLIRVRKTKAQLDLMPRCMFVHQNVPAVDAKEKNWLGQETKLEHLDKAIKLAAREEGFTEITKFNQVIKYDSESHSWYFPDLLSGSPPKATISQHYTLKANELRQYLEQLMRISPSKLTISGFFLRMTDLWNAMLHDDFVFSFRNTQDIISCTVLNDEISHEVDSFKSRNILEQRKTCESFCSFISIEEFIRERERLLRDMNVAIEKNFVNMKANLQFIIDASDICAASKKQYEVSLSEVQVRECLRINGEMEKEIAVHLRKLEYQNDLSVIGLQKNLEYLEKCIEEVERDNLNETVINEFEKTWRQLITDNQLLVDNRRSLVQSKTEKTIRVSIKQWEMMDTLFLDTVVWSDLFHICKPFTAQMSQVTENDILQTHAPRKPTRSKTELANSKSYVDKANSNLNGAYKKWESQFQKMRGLDFDPSHLKQILCEAVQLLGFSKKEESEVLSATASTFSKSINATDGTDEISSSLPPGYRFTPAYTCGFIKFVCKYIYNRSLENSNIFISMTDPLADINERHQRSVSRFRQLTVETNSDSVSKQIFDYAERSFVTNLGELIKTEVCQADTRHPTFKSKRAFLRTIITGLTQETEYLTVVSEDKKVVFDNFMYYVQMAESKESESFFHNAIVKLLKDELTNACESETQTDFQKMVENRVGMIIDRAIDAFGHAEANAKGCSREYIRIFKEYTNETSEIDFRIYNLSGFTEAVVKKLNALYADFLSQANSSFETLVCKDDKAAIRPLFDKILGCRERCPFCLAPCSQSLDKHTGDHRASHYPMGVGGTVDVSGWFTNTQETRDASEEEQRKPGKLALSTCHAMVGTRVALRTIVTVNQATKWYHRDYHLFKNYKELDEYKDWDIQCIRNHNASLYWKWFMAQFGEELAKKYGALCPDIPESWKKVTLEEAKGSLDELDSNSF